MTSNRPETSASFNSSEASATETKLDEPSEIPKPYLPNVFDLVFPMGRARDVMDPSIPPEFLQSDAVDSSLLIGKGASFTVSRQSLPPGPEKISVLTDMGGWTVEKVVNAPRRPSHIVYKSARIRFHANGDPATPEDGRAMLSVLTELHVLLHPPLRKHPNIISLLALAWGSNHAEPLHRLPALVVEYGDMGTLADVQSKATLWPGAAKTRLCCGIASGLKALHEQGIVHGDIKPENIIICSDKDKFPVPKLADFGFAIIDSAEATPKYLAGTRTWRAPESFAPVPAAKLKLTDIYSFGLVVWSIAAQLNDPFDLVLPRPESPEMRFTEIDRLKMNDEITVISQWENWFPLWVAQHISHFLNFVNAKNAEVGAPQFPIPSMQQGLLGQDNFKNLTPVHRRSFTAQLISNSFGLSLSKTAFPQHLNSIFSCTLTKDPDQRSLETAIKFLENQGSDPLQDFPKLSLEQTESRDFQVDTANPRSVEEVPSNLPSIEPGNGSGPKYLVTNTSNETKISHQYPIRHTSQNTIIGTQNRQTANKSIDWASLGFKFHRYSWQVVRDIDPAVQRFVVRSLDVLNDGAAKFFLSACLINGYGTKINPQRAVDCMIEAASRGHYSARANLYRMSIVCGKPLSADVPVLEYLKQAALDGSRSALQDLIKLQRQEALQHWKLIRYGFGGVGVNWYAKDQWLHGLEQGSFLNADFDIESLGTKEALSDVVVNLRGDHIIHAAAAVGACRFLKPLLEDGILRVNQRNASGETAILCACRSGHPEMVMLLLNNGADASLQALNGESPLHWLSSFDPNTIDVRRVGEDLVTRGGAMVDAVTTERVSHSRIFKFIDVDFQMPGTPLGWAVHDNNPQAVTFLLSKGADPNWSLQDSDLSPLCWAAFYHHDYCLKLLVEHLEKTVNVLTTAEGEKDLRHAVHYGPLVQHAIHAADNFSMILRNGTNCLYLLKSTLSYLQEKTKLISFKLDTNDTLLHFAAREGHAEAVGFILDLSWCVSEINDPGGRYGRTAILESVRWNYLSLFRRLLKHGADPHVLSASPYDESESGRVWSALHLFADQAHDDDMSLVDELLAAGLPVDGDQSHDIETPLNVSIRRNAFHLADHLRAKGASLEITSHRSSLLVSRRRLTILGHTITLNARYSFNSLDYLLKAGAGFIVSPEQGLTALHLCAIVPEGLTYLDGTPLKQADFDMSTSRTITNTLLAHFDSSEQINQRLLNSVPESLLPKIEKEIGDVAGTLEFFTEHGETALHLAVEVGNIQVVELLIAAGADKDLVCYNETLRFETAADIAERIWRDRQPELYGRLMDQLAD